MKSALRQTVILAVLSLALGYQVRSQEAIRGLPCIQRLHQLFCRNQGNTYPNERIESFIELNKALTRRMFGEFQAEEVRFPDIQQFRTVDFPEHLRPKDARARAGTLATLSARQRARQRFDATRARLRAARARASATRTSAGRDEARRAMARVQPTRVVTRTPVKRTATRPPFAGNVFLSGGEELIAAASQPAARYPQRQSPAANQRAAVRAGSARRPMAVGRRSCGPISGGGRGGGCAVVAPPSGGRRRYQYAEPENPLTLPDKRYVHPAPQKPLRLPREPLRLSEPLRIKRSSPLSNTTIPAAEEEEQEEEEEQQAGGSSRRRRQSSRRASSAPRQAIPAPPKIDKGSKHLVDSCESKIEITTPFWAANSAGEIRAIVNTKHFPQAIHQEICKGTKTSRCSGECACEQKYTYHRLLAYDPDNDCKGIFIDWFLFPSCCACRCPP